MADSLNNATLVGNLGRNPDAIKDGIAFSLATSERWKDKDGRPQERTDWHRVVIFGRRAETLKTLLHTGSRVLVEGAIRSSQYEDKDGNKRTSVDINARRVMLLDPPPAGARGARRDDQDDDAPGGTQ